MATIDPLIYQCSRCFRALSDSSHLVSTGENSTITLSAVSENVVCATSILNEIGKSFLRKEVKIWCKCSSNLGVLVLLRQSLSKNFTTKYEILDDAIMSYTVGSTTVRERQSAQDMTDKFVNLVEKLEDEILRHSERLELIEEILDSPNVGIKEKNLAKKRKK